MKSSSERRGWSARRLAAGLACGALIATLGCTGAIEGAPPGAGREGPAGRIPRGDGGQGGGASVGAGAAAPAAAHGSGSGTGGGAAGTSGAATIEPFPTAPARAARLTRREYANTIRDLFGAEVLGDAATTIDRDHLSDGSLALGAREVAVSRAGVRAYSEAAEGIAARAVANTEWRKRWAACAESALDAACAGQIADALVLRLYRRPATKGERDRQAKVIIDVAAATSDRTKGLQAGLTALLLSPKFTHRIEAGAPAGGGPALTGHELASRLSYLLWETTPDEALLAAAADGSLVTTAGLTRQVDRLLGDRARVKQGVRALFDDVFNVPAVETVQKDAARFPMDNPALRASMREATSRMVEEVLVAREGRLLDLYDTNVAFVDRALAPIYGVPAEGDGFRAIELPAGGARGGVLSEPSLLAAHAGPTLTSPTFRGKFIREHLLCSVVPPPPKDVDNSLPVNAAGRTRREQIENHMKNPACAPCHALIDPIGFGLEAFDALGRAQTKDNGLDIDATGALDGVAFDGPRGLARALRGHPDALSCLVGHVYAHVIGRRWNDPAAKPSLVALATQADGHILPMLRALVLSDAFRTLAAP
jgi:hypothetical protein